MGKAGKGFKMIQVTKSNISGDVTLILGDSDGKRVCVNKFKTMWYLTGASMGIGSPRISPVVPLKRV